MAESQEKKQKRKKDIHGTQLEAGSNELIRVGSNIEDVMDLVVFLKDRTGVHFTLEDAPQSKCENLIDLVINEQGLPPEASDIFSLWLVSPIIELRLKKNHNPFTVVQRWDGLCTLYTNASDKEIQESEPVLMFQRDVFFKREREHLIKNEKILYYLYHEAKFNVLESRYILHEEDYHTLAGIQAIIQMGKYDDKTAIADYKANLNKYYPLFMAVPSRFKIFGRNTSTPCEQQFMEAHKKASAQLSGEPELAEQYKNYLKILWEYPFYGGAFFSGEVEVKLGKIRKLIFPSPLIKVTICINTEGIAIFDKLKDEFLLYMPFSKLSWTYVDKAWDGDNDPEPMLIIQFPSDQRTVAGDKTVTKLLQIMSGEAKLMDALIETLVAKILEDKRRISSDIDVVDAYKGHVPATISSDIDLNPTQQEKHPQKPATKTPVSDVSYKQLFNKLDRLVLETYTTDGEEVE
ncbi:putative FERM domain-containing protein FRMD8P1 isoform X2 [Physella acuta]|uniref:putative FERM domain-containing protein FRMD8P1 isoform X2 n=1 Tax=Physella acuta TaxID=109671 RepID=UPI0027DD2A78|nr:putative FERM domain-containing protein FRMD8P1 isoform X2 [Physella acuta]